MSSAQPASGQSPQHVPPSRQAVLQQATPGLPQEKSEVHAVLQNSLPSLSVEQY